MNVGLVHDIGSCVRQGCKIAPRQFLEPMMEGTVHRRMTSITVENKIFTDLEYAVADDYALLAEMLEHYLIIMIIIIRQFIRRRNMSVKSLQGRRTENTLLVLSYLFLYCQ